jgi:hypothetical protein
MVITEQMNLELALEIFLEKPHRTWRALSTYLSLKYPDQDFGDGNQIYGMCLETDAVQFLKEYLQTCSETERALLLTHPSPAIRRLAESPLNQLKNMPAYIDEIQSHDFEA